MSIIELYNRIQGWLWLYDHVPFRTSTNKVVSNFNESVKQDWHREMLSSIAEIEIPFELNNLPVGQNLQTVIKYARMPESQKVENIRNLLVEVLRYLIDNNLITKEINHN